MNVLERLGERFWFRPAVLCLVAFVAAEALVALDRRLGELSPPGWIDVFVNSVGESGSRDILGAIASSSLAVAGTTFSITIAVLALTSSTYGPRLVRNFMADRANQMVLGVFVATFLYSLLVLRSIRALGVPGEPEAEVFIPHLAVNGAVVLAVLNVGVLIFFIHHISDSIQISTIARRVRTDLRGTVDRLYPARVGRDAREVDDAEPDHDLPDQMETRAARVLAARTGYVRYVREDDLLDAACTHDVIVSMQVRPGRYVLEDSPLALVHPSGALHDELEAAVRAAVVIGDERTPFQDLEFAVQQLTELAVRALSPGTNDPYTAINALDDLSAGLSHLAEREIPSPARYDTGGNLRVHAPSSDAVDLLTVVVDSMRWYAAGHPSVMHRALKLVERVGRRTPDRKLRARLVSELDLMREAVERAGHHPHDLHRFAEDADRVARVLARRGLRPPVT